MIHLQVFCSKKSVDYGDGCVIMMDANFHRVLLFFNVSCDSISTITQQQKELHHLLFRILEYTLE